jgi:hypothetical protein
MATAIDARNRAAFMLGILGEGDVLRDDHTADMDAAYTEIYARLSAKSIAWWDEDDEIPDECITHVATMMAFSRTDDYSVSDSRYQRIAIRNAIAIPEMRELKTSDKFDVPVVRYY